MVKTFLNEKSDGTDGGVKHKILQRPVSSKSSVLVGPRGAADAEQLAAASRYAAVKMVTKKSESVSISMGKEDQNILEESAVIFASGDFKSAITLLIKHLNETKGQAEQRVWYLLLDAYQSTDQKAPFEKLSLYFANRFSSSPPSWVENNVSATNAEEAFGRNILMVSGSIKNLKKEKAQDFIAASREAKNFKIDITRMTLEEGDGILTGIDNLLNMMESVRYKKILGLFISSPIFLDTLKVRVASLKECINTSDQSYWLLLLELMLWLGMEESFEDYAFEYATVYEMSPPSYDPSYFEAMNKLVHEEVEEIAVVEDSKKDHEIVPPDVIDHQNVDGFLSEVMDSYSKNGKVFLNFKYVRRIDFYAAGAFTNFLNEKMINKELFVIDEALELIIILLESMGANDFISFNPRKRV